MKIPTHAKAAAHIGIHLWHGLHAAEGTAKIASRVPVVGHALGLAVRLGGAVAGAVKGVNSIDD